MKRTAERLSFAAGEISPALQHRRNLARVQAGVDVAENMVVTNDGLTRVPGSRYVAPLRNEAQKGRLFRFEFSKTDNFQLVMNGGYCRIFRDGGYVEASPGVPYEFAIPFAEADLESIIHVQEKDKIFIAWNGRPKEITRLSDTNWTVADYDNTKGPLKAQNTDTARTFQASAATGVVTITTDFDIFEAGHVNTIWRLDEGDRSTVPGWKPSEAFGALPQYRRNQGKVYEAIVAGSDAGLTGPSHDEGDETPAGNGNTTWRYLHSGFGYVRITAVTDARHATATVLSPLLPASCVAPATTFRWYAPAWSDVDGWPSFVMKNDSSLTWYRGNEFWGTRAFDFYNFEITETEANGLSGRLTPSDGTLANVEWALASTVVIIGATNQEWTLRGQNTIDAITWQNVRPIEGSTEGSANVRPVRVDGGALFLNRSREQLFFIDFDTVAEALKPKNLTDFASHALAAKAKELHWQRHPHKLLWARLDDGRLAGLTHRPDQDVLAWSRHPRSGGFVESHSTGPSANGEADEHWLIVRRTINGATRRYIEQVQPFFKPLSLSAPTAAGAWFVDCALRYAGAPATVISGLSHLIGQTVRVLADGGEINGLVVSGAGSITLPYPASDVIVGLPMVARVRTVPLEIEDLGSFGKRKSADSIFVQLHQSGTGKIRQNDDGHWSTLRAFGFDTSGPLPLFSGQIEVPVIGAADNTVIAELLIDNALPFTLAGLAPDLDVSD